MTREELADKIERLSEMASKDWRVLRCQFVDGDSDGGPGAACGITCHSDHPAHDDGRAPVVRDESYDECHHPASLVDMELAVLLRNNAEVIASSLRHAQYADEAAGDKD